jgi:CRISPR-associated endonuclease/helicase Cas3
LQNWWRDLSRWEPEGTTVTAFVVPWWIEMRPTADQFGQFFWDIYKRNPFPWQKELARRACAGDWPSPVALPTAAGKTALIDIAVFALSCGASGAARRIFFVVDRRIVVDEACERAGNLASALKRSLARRDQSVCRRVAESLREIANDNDAEPLLVATLRGGMPRDDSWARSPLQPTVCCSTVDQVGSSLLFRAYGSRSAYNWPIRAGLVSHDALILLDEAHCSTPFVETTKTIAARYRTWAEVSLPGKLTVVELTATPDGPAQFSYSQEDLKDEVLGPRWKTSKPVRLVTVGGITETDDQILTERMAQEATAFANGGARVIGVVANRVSTARDIFAKLEFLAPARTILLTGRARPWDRDRIWHTWRPSIAAGRAIEPDEPVFVVATQCIEVGANIDFDALVTEAASIDALEQRFGRLNRLGAPKESPGCIVVSKEQLREKCDDPVYGPSLSATWNWLTRHAVSIERKVATERGVSKKVRQKTIKDIVIDMGVLALRERLPAGEELQHLRMPKRHAPVLMPTHLDVLSQTSPEPQPSPDPAVFLHGPKAGPADIQVVWRADLEDVAPENWADLVAVCPPSAVEELPVPVYAVQQWLRGEVITDISDVEGTGQDQGSSELGLPVLLWHGVDDCKPIWSPQLRPGMTIVAPATGRYGGCDKWGWNPAYRQPVSDIGDEVSLSTRGRAILRLHPTLINGWSAPGFVAPELKQIGECLSACAEVDDIREQLRRLDEVENLARWVKTVSRLLLRERNSKLRLVEHPESSETEDVRIAALAGSKRWRIRSKASVDDFYQEGEQSSRTTEVELEPHLEGVRSKAETYGRACGLPIQTCRSLDLAARFHDIGKADLRFQAWLRGGVFTIAPDRHLAKSAANGFDRIAMRRARESSGYPEGARHELQSVALLNNLIPETEVDFDLVLHLIASHHGRCRPFAPVVDDHHAVEVTYASDGKRWTVSSNHSLSCAGSGVSERFWRLTRRYGWFGLAYLETLLRLADCRESEDEQERKYVSRQRAAAQD